MNYYTLLPNCYNGLNSAQSLTYALPQRKNLSVLQLLSQALKRSISQFEACCIIPEVKTNDQSSKIAQQQEQNNEKTKIELSREGNIEKSNNFQIKEKEYHQQKIQILQANQQKPYKKSIQSTSNDQISSQKLLCQHNKPKESFPKIIKKQHMRSKKHSFHVVVPSVDLIQTAYLPAFFIDKQEIKGKKQSLLQRQVKNWDQKNKNRGDRREIRMLNR